MTFLSVAYVVDDDDSVRKKSSSALSLSLSQRSQSQNMLRSLTHSLLLPLRRQQQDRPSEPFRGREGGRDAAPFFLRPLPITYIAAESELARARARPGSEEEDEEERGQRGLLRWALLPLYSLWAAAAAAAERQFDSGKDGGGSDGAAAGPPAGPKGVPPCPALQPARPRPVPNWFPPPKAERGKEGGRAGG